MVGSGLVTMINSSDIIKEAFELLGISFNRDYCAKFFISLSGEFPGWLSNAVRNRIENAKTNIVFYPGARKETDENLKLIFPGTKVIWVEASADTRYKRIRGRVSGGKAGEDSLSRADFDRQDLASNELYRPSSPDFEIDNNWDIANLRVQIQRLQRCISLSPVHSTQA